jgi:hypothetical protein
MPAQGPRRRLARRPTVEAHRHALEEEDEGVALVERAEPVLLVEARRPKA